MPDNIDSFTEVGDIKIAIIGTVLLFGLFVVVIWRILPEHIRHKIKG